MSPAFNRLQNWPLAIALLGGVGLVITFLAPVFTVSVRWALLLALLLFTIRWPMSLRWLRSRAGVFVIASMFWTLLTLLWSVQPLLTLMKAMAFALVVVALTSAGYRWLRVNPMRYALAFLFPLMVAALLAGVLGRTDESAYAAGPGMDLYRGLTGNSNMFGSLMFMVSPLALWNFHCNSGRAARRVAWAAVLLLIFIMLLLSVSRASIVAFIVLLAAYGLTLRIARRALIVVFGVLAVTSALMIWPGTLHGLEAKYVRKNLQVQNSAVAYSRLEPWKVSWQMAREGGWLGAGYGVSIGAGAFKGGLTTVGYGREKGNTQLAVMEETGIVGLVLHFLVAGSVLGLVWRTIRASRDENVRALAAIVGGALLGALVIGIFEAWWVAPGAPESIWFWTMVGVALGLDGSAPAHSARRAEATARDARVAASQVGR